MAKTAGSANRGAEFDLAIIGAGSAGLSVAYPAARLGLRVALIERGRMGGECLNSGCVPSKALLAAAHAATDARAAGRLGVRLAAPEIDWAAVQAHVRAAIAAIAPNDAAERYRGLGATVLEDEARFVAADTLAVGGRRVTARRIVIAAGSRPAMPDIPGLAALDPLTSETLLPALPRPDHLLILGAGAVGIEMAQAHAALGCRVTLIEADRIAAREDEELADGLRAVLTAQGVTILEHAKVASAEPGPALVLQDGRRIAGTHLLVATGRRPNVEALGLDAGGVAATARGVATDLGLRSTSNRRVWAAGDIADPAGIGPRYLTHAGSYHAGIVLRRAVFRIPARIDYAALPRVTYTDPELAQVGQTETEARAAGRTVAVWRTPLAENDRAQAEGRTEGLVKLVTSGGRLLGAGILAPHAGEMVGGIGLAIARGIPLSALAGQVLPYPTLAEAAKRAASQGPSARLFSRPAMSLAHLLARLP